MFPSLFRSRWWSLKQFTLSPWLPPNSTSWLRDRVVSSLSGICWCTWVMSLLWRIIDWWAADRAPSPPPPTRPTPPSRSLIRIRFYLWSCLWQLVVTIESPCSSFSFNLSSLVHLIWAIAEFSWISCGCAFEFWSTLFIATPTNTPLLPPSGPLIACIGSRGVWMITTAAMTVRDVIVVFGWWRVCRPLSKWCCCCCCSLRFLKKYNVARFKTYVWWCCSSCVHFGGFSFQVGWSSYGSLSYNCFSFSLISIPKHSFWDSYFSSFMSLYKNELFHLSV